MAQEYTLKLNIQADGSQAIAEGKRVLDTLSRGQTAPAGSPAPAQEQASAEAKAALQERLAMDRAALQERISMAKAAIQERISLAKAALQDRISMERDALRARLEMAKSASHATPESNGVDAKESSPEKPSTQADEARAALKERIEMEKRALQERIEMERKALQERLNAEEAKKKEIGENAAEKKESPGDSSRDGDTPVSSALSLKGKGNSKWGAFFSSFSAIGYAIGKAFSGAVSVAMGAMKAISSFVLGPFKMAWAGLGISLKLLAAGVGLLAAKIYAVKKLLDPAGKMQSFSSQIEVMLKDPIAARRRLAELSRYARDTNYTPEEVIAAGNRLQAFGIYSMRTLKLAGDAANAFGKSIDEVITSLSYLNAGRAGEAMESLARFGVSRDALKGYGVKFKKSGELITEPKKALQAVLRFFEENYGGMTERIGKTWVGAMRQVSGELFDAMAKGFSRALKPATEFVTGSLIPLIRRIGESLSRVDWMAVLDGPLRSARALLSVIGNLSDPRTRDQGKAQLKSLWDGLKETGAGFIQALSTLFQGYLQSLASTLGRFISSDGFGKILSASVDSFKAVLHAGIASIKTIFFSLPDSLQFTIESILEKIPMLKYKGRITKERNAELSPILKLLLRGEDPQSIPEYLRTALKDALDNTPKTRIAGVQGAHSIVGRTEDDVIHEAIERFKENEKVYEYYMENFLKSRKESMEREASGKIASEWEKANDSSLRALSSLSDAVGAFVESVDVSPLKNAFHEAGKILMDSAKPLVRAINGINAYSGGFIPYDYNAIYSMLGKDVADKWRQPMIDARREFLEKKAAYGRGEITQAEWHEYNTGKAQRERRMKMLEKQRQVIQEALPKPDPFVWEANRKIAEIRARYARLEKEKRQEYRNGPMDEKAWNSYKSERGERAQAMNAEIQGVIRAAEEKRALSRANGQEEKKAEMDREEKRDQVRADTLSVIHSMSRRLDDMERQISVISRAYASA